NPAPPPAPEIAPAGTPDLRPQADPAEAPGSEAQPGKRRPFGFGKRREKTEPAAPQAPAVTIRTPEAPETGSDTTQGIKQVTPRPPVSQPLAPSGSAPVSGQARVAALRQEADRSDSRARRAAASLTPEEERERLTVFGARGEQKVGGKPRFLGLILTVLLLLFLAAVAAFSSVLLGDEISRFFAPSQAEDVALAAPGEISEGAPSPASVDLAAEEPDAEEDADAMLAALDLPPPASEGFEELPAPRVTERSQMTSDEAAETYAVTGIWQRAPNAPARPPQTNAEDVYVASIDPEVQQFDAVALPDLDAGPREDLSLEPVRLPPGPGVRFDLDDRGLVKASAEGTVSPDGVRIFTGLPPQTPPLRDPVPEAAPEGPADEAAPAEGEAAAPESAGESPAPDPAADPALSGFRPRGRPGDLIEQTERAVLGGVSLAELEQMRPQMRPLTAQEEALALDLPVTDQAIGASLTPLPRPRSMEAIVQEAVKQASNAPAVAIAPGPSIPQNASVAKSATLSDQINLREVSLIGIYGKDSSRRALVRLPSGKYQKVQVGDRIDGGRIAAISEDELRYVKSGRNVVLKMPRG
ncbi:pilus assembly protein PilP, partial [Salipiger sp. PrR003]|uniref:pilus assembly protein PilP n=2 Tax=unclassified Salipiger TaxID=2640570 RepID=UPI0013D931A2